MISIGLGINRQKKPSGGGLEFPVSGISVLAWWNPVSSMVTDTSSGSISDGEVVGSVLDASGGGLHLSEHTNNSNRTTWKESGLNGHPVLRSDGTTDLENTSLAANQPTTVFIVAKPNASDTQIWIDGDHTGSRNLIGNVADYFASAGTSLGAGGPITFDWKYITAVYNGSSSVLRVNGVELKTGNAGLDNRQGVTLFGRYDADRLLDGDIAEVIIADGAVSGSDLTSIEGYITSKYGL